MTTENPIANVNATATPVKAGEVLKEVNSENGKANPGKGKGKAATPAKAATEDKTPKITLDPFKLPAPTLKNVERKKVQKSRELQHRKDLQDVREGGAVEQYGELMREAAKNGTAYPFPPIEIIEDNKDGTLWLWDGYQRLGGAELANLKEIPANVRKGTFADALMLSLGSNGENSVIPRTRGDAQRAICALLDNEEVKEAAIKAAKGKGGIHRVFAQICKTSMGTVDWALKSRGLKPKGNELVKYTPPKETEEKSEPTASPSLSVTGAGPTGQLTESQQLKKDIEKYQEIKNLTDEKLLGEAEKNVKRIGAIMSIYAMDDDLATESRTVFAKAGFPIDSGFDKEAAKEGKSFVPFLAILEHCKPLAALCEAIKELEKKAEAARTKAEEAAAKEAADAEAAKGKGKEKPAAK